MIDVTAGDLRYGFGTFPVIWGMPDKGGRRPAIQIVTTLSPPAEARAAYGGRMTRARQKPEERRERARLRSERRRRAHGIGPRKPAQKPWLAEGVSRSTWYRRRKQARERAELAAQQAAFERAEAFVAQLQAELALAAWRHAEMAAIIAELAA
jgi:hypothetical protein